MSGSSRRWFLGHVTGAALLAMLVWQAWYGPAAQTQTPAPARAVVTIPDLAGTWDGRVSVRPANGETVPWAKTVAPGRILPDGTRAGANYVSNFPDVNERAQAYMKIFDEGLSPK